MKRFAVVDANGQLISTHTSIWPAKRAVQLDPTLEVRVLEDGAWVAPRKLT